MIAVTVYSQESEPRPCFVVCPELVAATQGRPASDWLRVGCSAYATLCVAANEDDRLIQIPSNRKLGLTLTSARQVAARPQLREAVSGGGPGVFAPSRARCIGSRRLCSRCRSGPIALATNACTDDACRRFRGAPPRTVGLTRLDMKSATAPWRGSRPSGQPARQPWGFFVFLMPSARLTSDVRV